VRKKLRELREQARDIETFLGEVQGRLRDAERARENAGRQALEASYKSQHEQAERQRHQAERELLEALEPPARKWFVQFSVQTVCREELQRLLKGG
jgi:hypothetical protein